ncbi:uncharacterized protein LOC118459075 [Anopheles albimanus]|uniref:Uncharacterized protein n=1 Tax=Anopheles albimanus TaxID=7167 RepID=A0A182F9C9_ANOAL|nr:uncharacterized protein LOC118459075 [Anopheles albimanus]
MKCSVLIAATVLLMATCRGLCDGASVPEGELVLHRNRRTVQHFVEYFANIFRLSAGGSSPKKAHSKQDHRASPLTGVLKASGSKFSGFSGTKEREPTLQQDLPTWIADRPEKLENPFSEALEADALEPTRVSLLSTTREPEETTPASTTTAAPPTTTMTEAAAQPTELPAEAAEASAAPEAAPATSEADNTDSDNSETPATNDTPSSVDPASGASTEATGDIDPAAVNGLSSQSEVRQDSFQPTPVPLVSYQHYVQPASIWPAPAGYQNPYPMMQYFSNNVFFPGHAQFPLAAPFQPQAQAPLVQQTHHLHQQQKQHQQGYLSQQPLYDNRLHYPTAQAGQSYQDQAAKSQSRVKLHNNHYDLVTYHDDTAPAATNYQSQSFGNARFQPHEY